MPKNYGCVNGRIYRDEQPVSERKKRDEKKRDLKKDEYWRDLIHGGGAVGRTEVR